VTVLNGRRQNARPLPLSGWAGNNPASSREKNTPTPDLDRLSMAGNNYRYQQKLQPEQKQKLYKRHRQGAFVRSGASLFMWLCAFTTFLVGMIQINHLLGVSFSIVYLILINPPTLWVLKKISRQRVYEYFSIFINFLEIVGYTAVIYFLGGINALYLSPIYAALITYVGTVGPPRLPFIIAGICAATLSVSAVMEYVGLIPHQDPFWKYQPPGLSQIGIILTNICLLFVVAFITSYTGNILRKNKKRLREQNLELDHSRSELKSAAETLERKNIELQMTANRAQESDRMKSEFLANMSHEFRTPLNHIIGFTEVVADKKFGNLNEDQVKYMNNVLQSGRHLLSLVNDILDLSKVESGKLKLELSTFNLRLLLENSLTMIKEKASKHGISLSIDRNGIPETIRADERKLKQVMYNLLSNAAKFTPDGGSIKITAKILSDSQMKRSKSMGGETSNIQNLKSNVEIRVSDTGIGIKKENLEHIFKPFEQVDNTASRKYQGTGLGLSLTKKLVELHGGKIWAESDGEGKGSVLHFIIPANL
jgi:signal transduction histidine kinase